MAKAPTAAAAPADEPVDPVEAPTAAAAPADVSEADGEPGEEPEPEPLPTHIPMVHPEGGTCDAYETTEEGAVMVPVEDVAIMQSHGFIPAAD